MSSKDPLDMTSDELADYILTQMSAEDALRKLLSAQMLSAGKIMYQTSEIELSDGMRPYALIMIAAKLLGWDVAFESDQENMRGMAIGTKEYLKECIK